MAKIKTSTAATTKQRTSRARVEYAMHFTTIQNDTSNGVVEASLPCRNIDSTMEGDPVIEALTPMEPMADRPARARAVKLAKHLRRKEVHSLRVLQAAYARSFKKSKMCGDEDE
ncbi:uncharacterized protein IUM83_06538 [Phytophthora cinnamomi]|uniref:uncharacterized protein n=1 Tax=Phytophthora cinnamomi TaxID=4785 RepID=UPI00355A6B00|nr:hypothetical protein IUM83_06538 [Phytophthora cinnamomi]